VPVRFEMLKAFTPGDPLADGVKRSKERSPIGIGSARLGSKGQNVSPRKMIIPRFKLPSYDPRGYPYYKKIRELCAHEYHLFRW
jgi:hypothetical protein